MADDDVRVPAGWYPDPLGLPQLRWWDNHAWTEHTSDARQPMVATETTATKLAYADDDEPEYSTGLPYADDDEQPATDGLTRRERRERERLVEGEAGALAPIVEQPAFAEPLLSLEAPERDQVTVDEPSPAERLTDATTLDDAPTSAPFELDTRFDDLLGEPVAPRAATHHVSESTQFFVPETAAAPQYAGAYGMRYELPPPVEENEMPVGTGPAWAIAFMPLVMLLIGMLFLVSGLAGRASSLFVVFILGVPYVAVVGLAIADQSILKKRGFRHAAHWFWSLLTAPAYLIVRLAGVVRETGRGFGPLLSWVGFAAAAAASLLLVPGLIIAAAPQTFSEAAQVSIERDASILGANLDVDCPDVPPQLVGGSFQCAATNTDGETFNVTVSLQRANGWIEWRVDNWGIYSIAS